MGLTSDAKEAKGPKLRDLPRVSASSGWGWAREVPAAGEGWGLPSREDLLHVAAHEVAELRRFLVLGRVGALRGGEGLVGRGAAVLAPGRVRGRLAHVVLAVCGLRGLALRGALSWGAVPILQLWGRRLRRRGDRRLGPKVNQRAHGDLRGLHGSGRGLRSRTSGWEVGDGVPRCVSRNPRLTGSPLGTWVLLGSRWPLGSTPPGWPRGP